MTAHHVADDGGPPGEGGAASPDAMALVGTPYRCLGRLGHGGMGVVLDAEHVALGKRVVVKLLHKELAGRDDLVDRMRVEAQVLARLQHENLVGVHDLGRTPEGRPYLVMDRLSGRSFREELAARGPLPVATAVDLVAQALAGLAAAHGAGIVHRDIKLDNLFVCDADARGRRVVKVLDFGIAKVLASAPGGGPAPVAYPTEEGALMGTPRFLSPEQAKGQRVDARTDLYAMGIVLYALVAGRGPFHHLTCAVELLKAHAFLRPVPPSEIAAQPISFALDRVILRALEKAPGDRHPSAEAFIDALAQPAIHPVAPAPVAAAGAPAPAAPFEVSADLPTIAEAPRPAPPPSGGRVSDAPLATSRTWLVFTLVVLASGAVFTTLAELFLPAR